LRRVIATGRAKILFATVSHHAGRWWVSLNVEAADLHPAHQHPARDPQDHGRWVGCACGAMRGDLMSADRVFTCGCGYSADRDCNAAVNLARWGQTHHHEHHLEPRTPKQRGRATNARRRDGTDQHPTRAGETSPVDAGTDVHTTPAA
jgi:hypothetical protein